LQRPTASANLTRMFSRYWRLDDLAGVDLLRADASAHRYARHSHEGYALGAVAAGAHAFTAHGKLWTAVPGCLVTVNPDQAHDGGPAARAGVYSYRMMYVDAASFTAALADASGRDSAAMPFFADAVVHDAQLAQQVLRLHRLLERPEARLERETLLMTVLVEFARRHGRAASDDTRRPHAPRPVERALDYLTERFADDLSLAELAAHAGLSRCHLLRAFRHHFGLPPHLYQTQLRLRHARKLLLAGEAPAVAAAAAGFADQSHLIRKFKAAYGVTPGQYLGRHATRNRCRGHLHI